MKIRTLLLVFAFTLPAFAATLDQTLIAKQQALTAAEKRHDKAYISSQLDPDFIEVAPDGQRYTKEEALRNLDNVRIDDFNLSNFRVVVLSHDSAILIFNVDVKGTYKGQPASGRMTVSATWIRAGAGWKLRFAQVTPVPPEQTKEVK